jgi:hypothetical protein
MALSDIENPESVKAAILEFEELGREAFLSKYGFTQSKVYFLKFDGKEFDSKAILGAAHFFETGRALKASEFSGGEPTVRKLNQLGFSVSTKLPEFSKLKKEHVQAALNEYFTVGAEVFYGKYAGTPSIRYFIKEQGVEIDAKPVLLAALRMIPEYSDFEPNDVPGNRRNVADPLRNLGFEVIDKQGIRFWQVMHAKTGQQAEDLGYLFSPKKKANGARNKWYDNMAEARPGDIVYSYWDKEVHAIGVVVESAVTGNNPFVEERFGESGWLLRVDFQTLENPFSPKENFEYLKPVLTDLDSKSFAPDGNPIMGYLKEISKELAQRYDNLAGGFLKNPKVAIKVKPGVELKEVPALELLANEVLLDYSFLLEIEELLEDKKQLIFYGPPGAGKTYLALKIAEALSDGNDDKNPVELVQFHPSYAYEDFVEGFRPTESGNFVLKQGKLLSIAQRAKDNPNTKFFLIIDEINRGNVAKIFGEMYFLLEYRDHEIQLQYSDAAFSMPKNLYFIGTMNSADRSIGLIDSALRRRFHFVSFYPTEIEMKDLLRNWLKQNAPDVEWVADVVDRVNSEIDRNFAVGPSHFMKPNLDEALVKKIWNRSVLPYLEDIFFNQESKVKEYELDRLRTLKRLKQDDSAGVDEDQDDDSAAS